MILGGGGGGAAAAAAAAEAEEEEEEEEEEEVPLFTIHSVIHITYYIITRLEIKQASNLKKSKSKCSFSRQVKRLDVKGT